MNMFKSKLFLNLMIFSLLGLNFALMYWLDTRAGSMWGWNATDFVNGHVFHLKDVIAIGQFVIFAMTIDMVMRRLVSSFNAHSKQFQIPAILVQCFSILIYVLVGVAGFILLYDHSVTHLFALSGAIGLGVGYAFRDVIADTVNSIAIQADGLISINDWIEVADGEKSQYFQVVQFDRRMVTLRNRYDYLVKIPNTRFMGMSYINLSKQTEGRGSRRSLEIQLDALNNSEKVLDILNLALESILNGNKDFVHTYYCGINKLAEGSVTYKILYECIPSMKVTASEAFVMKTVLRFLAAAGMNTGSSMEVQTLDKHLSKTSNRLYETYEYSPLKVLSHTEALELSKTARIVSCFKGEQLIHQGEHADSMFLVSEGSLEVKIRDKQDQLVTVASLWPGDCVGEMSLLTGAPRSADVFARVDSMLVEIKKENIAPIFESNPRLIGEISELLAKRQAQSAAMTDGGSKDGLRTQSENLAKKILHYFFK